MSLQEFKCPNCGGPIRFNVGTDEMVCPYCDSVISIEALKLLDEVPEQESEPLSWGYESTEWGAEEQEGMVVYSCRSCAGEIIADETLGATSCPFCDNPVVMTSKFSGSLKPDLVIPFKLDKKQAIEALQKHYLGKKLLPDVFKQQNHLEEVKGVYVPFWLFDAETDAKVRYLATRIRHWSDSSYRYTETNFYHVFREGEIGFNYVPADASSAIDDILMQSIEPFKMEEAVDFKTAYLAGFFANKYDVEAKESAVIANQRIKNSTEASFAQTVKNYATVIPERIDIKLNSGEMNYALLPVWLLSTKWQDKSYVFAMNGQTGKFVGDLPLDKGKYWSSFGKVFGISATVFLAISLTVLGLL
jgi:DNA-directed RNA polymerase subunit RPC12/RpoP